MISGHMLVSINGGIYKRYGLLNGTFYENMEDLGGKPILGDLQILQINTVVILAIGGVHSPAG